MCAASLDVMRWYCDLLGSGCFHIFIVAELAEARPMWVDAQHPIIYVVTNLSGIICHVSSPAHSLVEVSCIISVDSFPQVVPSQATLWLVHVHDRYSTSCFLYCSFFHVDLFCLMNWSLLPLPHILLCLLIPGCLLDSSWLRIHKRNKTLVFLNIFACVITEA